MADSAVELELKLVAKDMESFLSEVKSRLGSVAEQVNKIAAAQSKADTGHADRGKADAKNAKTQAAAEEAQESRRKKSHNNRLGDEKDFSAFKERLEKRMGRRENSIVNGQSVGLAAGGALLASGGTLTQSAMVGSFAHVIGSAIGKVQAVSQLRGARGRYGAAVAAEDRDAMMEESGNVTGGQLLSAAATKNLVVAGVMAGVAVAGKIGSWAYANEGAENALFQATGTRTNMLEAEADRLADRGIDRREGMGLLTQYGKSTGINERGAGSAFDYVTEMQQDFGPGAAQSAMGLGGSLRSKGALTGTDAEKDRKLHDVLSDAVSVGMVTGLDRGRLPELVDAISQVVAATPAGGTVDPGAIARNMAYAGQQGAQFQGAGGVAPLMALGNIAAGTSGGEQGDMLANMAVMMNGTMGDEYGPEFGLLKAKAEARKDPVKALGPLFAKITQGDKKAKGRLASFLVQGGMATTEEVMAMINMTEGGPLKEGGDTSYPKTPENLRAMQKQAARITNAGVSAGQTGHDTAASAMSLLAGSADFLAEEFNDLAFVVKMLKDSYSVTPASHRASVERIGGTATPAAPGATRGLAKSVTDG